MMDQIAAVPGECEYLTGAVCLCQTPEVQYCNNNQEYFIDEIRMCQLRTEV
jgi:hypothetical protein